MVIFWSQRSKRMISVSSHIDLEKLEEYVYMIALITKAGWERYEHCWESEHDIRGRGDYDCYDRFPKFETLWRHPVHGCAKTLEEAYWDTVNPDEFERTQKLNEAWEKYLCEKAKSGKKNAL